MVIKKEKEVKIKKAVKPKAVKPKVKKEIKKDKKEKEEKKIDTEIEEKEEKKIKTEKEEKKIEELIVKSIIEVNPKEICPKSEDIRQAIKEGRPLSKKKVKWMNENPQYFIEADFKNFIIDELE